MKICPVCHSENIKLDAGGYTGKYRCEDCGYVGVLIIEMEDEQEGDAEK